MVRVPVGNKIDLFFPLHDGATDKFVRAVLRKKSDMSVIGTVTLDHIGDGNYADDSVTMINEQVSTRYRVFNDAAFTTPSPNHTNGIFGCEYIPDPVIPKFDEIKTSIDGQAGSLASAIIVFDDDELGTVIPDVQEYYAEIESDADITVSLDGDEINIETEVAAEIVIDAECKDD